MKNKLIQRRTLSSNDKDWQTVFDSSTNSSIFQSPDWAKRMERCLKSWVAKPLFFEFADGTQIIWSMLQHPTRRIFYRWEAMPLGLYGRPLIYGEWSPDKGGVILHSILAGRCLEVQYVEYPMYTPLNFILPKGLVQEVYPFETHLLELAESWELMWEKKFSSRIRNQVRRAEKEGLEVRQGFSMEDAKKFYLMYEGSTKTWGYNHPPYSEKFFLNLLDNAPNTIKLLFVEDKEKPVASGIFVEDTDFILYWFGAMDSIAKRKFPTYLLLSIVIKDAINKRKRYLNMGASGDLLGVQKFKELWGAKPVTYNIRIFKRVQFIKKIDRIASALRLLRGAMQ